MYCHNLVLFVFLYSLTLLMMMCLPPASAQKSNGPRWLIGDRESPCSPPCSRSHGKPVCGSDGRSYDTNCDLERAKCKDHTLTLAHRGRCKGKNWMRIDQPLPAPTLVSEVKELTEAAQTKCRTERIQALEQAKRPQESIFIPECNDDGTFAQVQCHTLTGYCWCVTTDGKPVSGSSVQNKTPVCSGNFREFMGTRAGTSGLSGSVTDKPPGPPSSGRKDLVSPLLHWAALKTKCVCNRCLCDRRVDGGCVPLYHCGFSPSTTRAYNAVSHKEISQNAIEHKWMMVPSPHQPWRHMLSQKRLQLRRCGLSSWCTKRTNRTVQTVGSQKVPSCDQERQTAQDEARQNLREAIFIPDCGLQGLYKPVQCHQSTGYCWCVLVDTGRPIPGTSARYKKPECDSAARSRDSEMEDPFRDRDLTGCPEGKKVEFITSLLDALTTDMVQAINSPTPSGGGRFVEPDPSHTLEERVVHWYFAQLDNNGSHNINKKEMKPFKRYVKKKAKPKRCARKFTDYCDLNKDKTISLQELKGCLGVNKEGSTTSSSQGTSRSSGLKMESSRR
ncbi:SPARC-related modular calcium-binding protein 1 isoform X2 [Sinocyclocheilus anshuiensis]|uniref:SPARC-related modular calcium-binding protein 1 isoform X2 n=1 Tax=Sinocyclocheilus anshuiensis TaxID=1608454 RepID=UPI0007B91CDB|nr:PREDICTED: SPARC-related modular calcium-binding protein 1-like isoform X2 [Sinocyclocheilus anshuiensis]